MYREREVDINHCQLVALFDIDRFLKMEEYRYHISLKHGWHLCATTWNKYYLQNRIDGEYVEEEFESLLEAVDYIHDQKLI